MESKEQCWWDLLVSEIKSSKTCMVTWWHSSSSCATFQLLSLYLTWKYQGSFSFSLEINKVIRDLLHSKLLDNKNLSGLLTRERSHQLIISGLLSDCRSVNVLINIYKLTRPVQTALKITVRSGLLRHYNYEL